jgi:hypothetical protein
MVETTPVVWKGRLLRFESVRGNYGSEPGCPTCGLQHRDPAMNGQVRHTRIMSDRRHCMSCGHPVVPLSVAISRHPFLPLSLLPFLPFFPCIHPYISSPSLSPSLPLLPSIHLISLPSSISSFHFELPPRTRTQRTRSNQHWTPRSNQHANSPPVAICRAHAPNHRSTDACDVSSSYLSSHPVNNQHAYLATRVRTDVEPRRPCPSPSPPPPLSLSLSLFLSLPSRHTSGSEMLRLHSQ